MKYYRIHSWQNYRVSPIEGEDVLTEGQGDVMPKDNDSGTSSYPDWEKNEYFSTYKDARYQLEKIAMSYRQTGGSPSVVVRDDVEKEHLFPK